MSKNINIILLSLLVIQAVLIAALYTPDSKNIQSEIHFLADLDPQDTVSILIHSAEGGEVHVTKSNQGAWFVSEGSLSYPADRKHIEDTLLRLTSLKSNVLVTQTESSHLRLKVADDVYERKIVLTDRNDKKHIVYLGSSTAPKTIHLRLQDSQKVYLAKGMSSWELNTDKDLWWDRNYIDEEIEKLQSIELTNSHGSLTLIKSGEEWHLENEKETSLSASAVSAFLDGVSEISLTKYLGQQGDAYNFEKPAASLTLTGQKGPLTLKVTAAADEENRYVVKSSESPFFVEVTEFPVEKLINTTKEQLTSTE